MRAEGPCGPFEGLSKALEGLSRAECPRGIECPVPGPTDLSRALDRGSRALEVWPSALGPGGPIEGPGKGRRAGRPGRGAGARDRRPAGRPHRSLPAACGWPARAGWEAPAVYGLNRPRLDQLDQGSIDLTEALRTPGRTRRRRRPPAALLPRLCRRLALLCGPGRGPRVPHLRQRHGPLPALRLPRRLRQVRALAGS